MSREPPILSRDAPRQAEKTDEGPPVNGTASGKVDHPFYGKATELFQAPAVRWCAGFSVFVVLALAPLSSIDLSRLVLVLIYSLAAIGLNLSLGYGGQFALVQPLVMAVSAYLSAVLSSVYGWNSLETLPLALAGGCAVGLIFVVPGIRLRGWYMAITTVFATLIIPNIVNLATYWTGGSNGIGGIKPLPGVPVGLLGDTRQYEIVLGISAVIVGLTARLVGSTWGTMLKALRDVPYAAQAVGVNTIRVKISLSLISSIPVAVAGWLWAHTQLFVSTDSFSFSLLILLLASVILGGRGTLWGPLVGVAVFETLSLFIGPYSAYNQIVLGIGILIVAIVTPEGILPVLRNFWSTQVLPFVLRDGDIGKVSRRTEAKRTLRSGAYAEVTSPTASDSVMQQADVRAEDRDASLSDGLDGGPSAIAALDAREISKSFGGILVLDKIDLQLRKGELVGLIGPNGSGKTTLLNVITGFVRPDEGEIRVQGVPLERVTPHRMALAGVARTFQVPFLIDGATARENIHLGLIGFRQHQSIGSGLVNSRSYRLRLEADEQRVEAVCDLLEIPDAIRDSLASDIPLGWRRVVEIGRAIVADTTIVCLDEPAAGLSGDELARLGSVMKHLTRLGHAVLLIEHNLDFVGAIADYTLTLEAGQVVSRFRPDSSGRKTRLNVRESSKSARSTDRGSDLPELAEEEADVDLQSREVIKDGSGPKESCLVVSHLNASYGDAQVLYGIDFEVFRGTVMGIIGPNGAGKTTLLRTVARLHRNSTGDIVFLGQSITGLQPWQISRLGLGKVREGARVFEDMTVEEHVVLGRRLSTMRAGPSPLVADLPELLELFPALQPRLRMKAGLLSGGQRQMLLLLMAFASSPACLLLDEPSAGLHERTAEEVFRSVRLLADRGVTLIVAEQDQRWLSGLADDVYLLQNGELRKGTSALAFA